MNKDQFIKWIEFNGWNLAYDMPQVWHRGDIWIDLNNYCIWIEINKPAYSIVHSDLVNEIIPFMRRNIPNLKDLPNA